MDRRISLAAVSRDGHLSLRRVERQQALIERLHAAHGIEISLHDLARSLGVSARTIARDVEAMRLSGLPIEVTRGRRGGARLSRRGAPQPITFDLPEIAALLASLAVLGPTASDSSAAAARKLVAALGE